MPSCASLDTAKGPLAFDRTRVMGIVNVTTDSFYAASRTALVEDACRAALEMADAGADIVDVGAESTRPGAAALSEEEEVARLLPVLEHIVPRLRIPVSVDTYKAGVALRALDAGAEVVNDVTALRGDPGMARLLGGRKVPVVLMHALWPPATMQESPEYVDVV